MTSLTSLEYFETMAEPSSEEIQQIRAQLAATMERLKLQQEKEKVGFAQLAPARARALTTHGSAFPRSPTPFPTPETPFSALSDSLMNSKRPKALAPPPYTICVAANCIRLRDMPNGNNTLKYCSRHNDLNPQKKRRIAVEIDVLEPPTPLEPASEVRTSRPTAKKRDFEEISLEIQEKKAEVLTKRQKKVAQKDDSLATCKKIDGLAGAASMAKTRAKTAQKEAQGTATVKPKAARGRGRGRGGRKSKALIVEVDSSENEDFAGESDAGGVEHLA